MGIPLVDFPPGLIEGSVRRAPITPFDVKSLSLFPGPRCATLWKFKLLSFFFKWVLSRCGSHDLPRGHQNVKHFDTFKISGPLFEICAHANCRERRDFPRGYDVKKWGAKTLTCALMLVGYEPRCINASFRWKVGAPLPRRVRSHFCGNVCEVTAPVLLLEEALCKHHAKPYCVYFQTENFIMT